MKVSIVIPAYNEESRIVPTLHKVTAFLARKPFASEIVVVDDGSLDETIAVVESLRKEIPSLRCLTSTENRGKGHAVRMGMLAAEGDVRVMFDADASMPAEELDRLLKPIFSESADIVIGSRYTEGSSSEKEQPLWRVLWSRLANQIVQRSLVPGIRDTQCGFKAFTAKAAVEVFSRCTVDGWAFDLEALALARHLQFTMEERGVVWHDDERSRVSPLRDFAKVAREFLAIRAKLKERAVKDNLETRGDLIAISCQET